MPDKNIPVYNEIRQFSYDFMIKRLDPSRIFQGLFFLTLLLGLIHPTRVLAEGDPRRQELIIISYTEYDWWLVYWQNNNLACEINVDHEGEPTGAEIYWQCGKKIYDLWRISDPCSAADSKNQVQCGGMYLFLAGSEIKQKEIQVELPTPKVWIGLKDCISMRSTDICVEIPSLLITAEEPLPNERITRIQGTMNGLPFICSGSSCEVPLRTTGKNGIPIVFWADSSYGDSTIHYQGRIRVSENVDELTVSPGWQVDIASEMNDFNTVEGCAKIWQAFPPLGTPPDWLSSPPHPYLLETDEPYAYLAGQLIFRGYVDVSDCDNFGLMANGYASQCGLEKARDTVRLWQNTFDTYIVQVSREKGLPSQLLKRIFAKESQFWPETRKITYYEYGPGHINELGADTVLMWNHDFYDQFCPLILENDICSLGYAMLDEWNQVLLRGALLSEMELDLPLIGEVVDPEQAYNSVSLFAETLLGNCSQVKQIITYELDQIPGEILSYEDLWRMTLANYHAGSGCLSKAVQEVIANEQNLDWDSVANALEIVCPAAVQYINDITY